MPLHGPCRPPSISPLHPRRHQLETRCDSTWEESENGARSGLSFQAHLKRSPNCAPKETEGRLRSWTKSMSQKVHPS